MVDAGADFDSALDAACDPDDSGADGGADGGGDGGAAADAGAEDGAEPPPHPIRPMGIRAPVASKNLRRLFVVSPVFIVSPYWFSGDRDCARSWHTDE
ncbi:hypothetical protein PO883_02235 [Massilia sp. DJPM01]|uniref:hypothetical protein n=1 Tax=Massilia sp. DJPM01 TaxID=3024404 RepID=UPI00259EEB1D|nr:hypothetical protein [Massilia sp. DJPM01]MDM5176018.1 hypothetical protein [Massilia sp. DJPM01]